MDIDLQVKQVDSDWIGENYKTIQGKLRVLGEPHLGKDLVVLLVRENSIEITNLGYIQRVQLQEDMGGGYWVVTDETPHSRILNELGLHERFLWYEFLVYPLPGINGYTGRGSMDELFPDPLDTDGP